MGASNVIVAAVTADVAVSNGPASYFGFVLRETAGSTATVRIYDNASAASGTLLDTIRLDANEDKGAWYGPQGIRANFGIYVDVVSGAVEGSVRYG